MVKGRKWILKQHFSGEPKIDDFELVEEELPELKNGEIMFRFVFEIMFRFVVEEIMFMFVFENR